MNDQRIAKMCLPTLRRGDSVNDKRYNWSLNLKDLLTRTGYEYLWTTNDPADIIANKQNILNKLQTQLLQADLERAAQSDSLKYLTSLRFVCSANSSKIQNM
jgi:glucan phosphoethanolaminetransferase (alkaline phosphatase superfamily)